ncbi:hypothetical protein SMICM304S_12205 [Streptomyces microflavus]
MARPCREATTWNGEKDSRRNPLTSMPSPNPAFSTEAENPNSRPRSSSGTAWRRDT